jgi:predicted DNA binding CopG/RHH family protein
MATAKRRIPSFRSEDDERGLWARADSTQYVDWQAAKTERLPKLRPTLRTISLRLPVAMIEDLKTIANRRDVPYQSLLKMFLAERIDRERHSAR